MTMENQGFEVINDSPASGEVNLEQYLSQPYVLYKHADASRNLQRVTIDILEFSFYLKEQNRVMKRKNYKELVVSLGLEGEDRKYLKVGVAFSDFDSKDLALVEPDTIFLLAKSSKKYQSVIDQLKNETNITQQRVRELIQLNRKPQKEKTSDANGNVWRQPQKGKKYCQIGAIHEEDEFTGTVIQRIVDEKGVPPQTVVRNAMSLVQAYSSEQLVWANNSTELNNDDLKSFFDFVKINTPNGVEAPNYSSSCTDTESQSPENEEGKEVTLGNEVDNSDASEPVVVCNSGADSEVNNDVNDSDASEPVMVCDSGTAKELSNDVNNSDVGESLVVFDSGADSEVNNDINNSDASQPVVVSGADLELEEAVIIAEYLSDIKTWTEVMDVMESCPVELKLLSWELLDENQKARLCQLKEEFEVSNIKVKTDEEISGTTLNPDSLNTLKVGDKVMWENCYPHLHSWQPFIITKIEGDEARLDYYANSVPLAELSLVE